MKELEQGREAAATTAAGDDADFDDDGDEVRSTSCS
jgi:hypothetical protein